jgi:phospholipid transport system substrate-binding protein
MYHYFYTLIVVAGLLLGTSVSSAASDAVAQSEKLQATIESALDVIYADGAVALSAEVKQAKVREIIESNYDFDVIIRRAIGRNWRLMDASEQEQVLDLVKRLVLKAYVKGMEGKTRPQITLGDATQISDKRMEIQSTIQLDQNTYYVLYRLGRMQSGWQIYDIVAENISVVSNYRQQIDDHFRKGDAAGLIARLEELIQQDDINDTKL